MKIFKVLILAGFISVLGIKEIYASSLDDLYRDIIRSDNRGYLPLFVKNRQAPDILIEEKDLADIKETPLPSSADLETIKLSTSLKQRTALAKARQVQWLKTVAAVKSNQVTPLELNDITTRVKENDPRAIEILAWMYTKGVGVRADFVEAFNLYKKAARMNVANAEKNALVVYKSMNEDQRRRIKKQH